MSITWRIKRKIMKTLIGNSSNPHPASFPYITGDGFRSFAAHRYERGTRLDPEKVMPKEIVFVQGDLLRTFFEMIHPQIKHPYILITQNADTNIDHSYCKYIDRKIIHWFAQNVVAVHEKITPIPIGLECLYHHNFGVPKVFDAAVKKSISKATAATRKSRIIFKFNIKSNPEERQPAYDFLSRFPLADELTGWPHPKKYLESLMSYRFVASPRGNGEDCHRTWEAMLVGTVPIVMKSVASDFFSKIGLPLLAIDSWDDITTLSEYDLKAKYDLILAKANRDPLYMDYWQNLIISKK